MEQTSALKRYLELERQLLAWRREHPQDSPEEDLLLDEMDDAWWSMSAQEREWVDARDLSLQ